MESAALVSQRVAIERLADHWLSRCSWAVWILSTNCAAPAFGESSSEERGVETVPHSDLQAVEHRSVLAKDKLARVAHRCGCWEGSLKQLVRRGRSVDERRLPELHPVETYN